MTETREVRFIASKSAGEVSGLFVVPPKPTALLVLAHGAGAGMKHPFMGTVAAKVAEAGVGTLRYQFPYTEKKMKRPDPPALLTATVRSAVLFAAREYPDLPLFAGGKSMGGRMTSTAQSSEPLPGVRGLVFFGFPLHPPGKPGTERAAHLAEVRIPMLFLQGTRDALADLELLKPVLAKLGEIPRLHILDGADHSFHVLKSSGRTDAEVMGEMISVSAAWMNECLEPSND